MEGFVRCISFDCFVDFNAEPHRNCPNYCPSVASILKISFFCKNKSIKKSGRFAYSVMGFFLFDQCSLSQFMTSCKQFTSQWIVQICHSTRKILCHRFYFFWPKKSGQKYEKLLYLNLISVIRNWLARVLVLLIRLTAVKNDFKLVNLTRVRFLRGLIF